MNRFLILFFLLISAASIAPAAESPEKKACIYFDAFDSLDKVGTLHAILLENLIGAFPNWTALRKPLATYRPDEVFECDTVFYLATHFFQKPPAAFYNDLAQFSLRGSVVWFNYKIGDFLPVFQKEVAAWSGESLGFMYNWIDQPAQPPSPKNLDPGFFRYFDYKGETFEKLARWNFEARNYMNSPELNIIELAQQGSKAQILATARHSKDGRTTPYAVRAPFTTGGQFFYFADSPFSFTHYEDRYFIFCDLLWDILREPPPSGPPRALVRIEDVNPTVNLTYLKWVIDTLTDRKVPLSFALIPYYSNLFSDGQGGPAPVWKPAWKYPEFWGFLRYAKARGIKFVFHGVAHQAGDLIGGYHGSSGADYEFWLYPENTPLPHDSPEFVIQLLEKGEEVFQRLGVQPIAWETPHYASSALDSILFGKLFAWTYHRPLYFEFDRRQDALLLPKHRMFECVTPECRNERIEVAQNLQVNANYSRFSGQISPFLIYKDVYGQKLIPETLGMVDYAFYNEGTWRLISHPRDIIRRARKLRVVRGAIASFFWHPDNLDRELPYYRTHPGNYETEGGPNSLIKIIDALQELGYVFKSIDTKEGVSK